MIFPMMSFFVIIYNETHKSLKQEDDIEEILFAYLLIFNAKSLQRSVNIILLLKYVLECFIFVGLFKIIV